MASTDFICETGKKALTTVSSDHREHRGCCQEPRSASQARHHRKQYVFALRVCANERSLTLDKPKFEV